VSRAGGVSTPRILVVDDEEDLRELLAFNLKREGYHIAQAATGMEALRLAASLVPNVMLLDIGLPDVSGVDVCRRIKATPVTRDIAVVMLSARASEADRVLGLEAGASDYVTKPFSLRELLLRIAMAVGRRHGGDELLMAGSIEVDRARMIVRVDGREVPLTQTERRLLTFLVEAGGRVRTRDELTRNVVESPTVADTRAIDTHVKRLRTKLGDAGGQIETVRSVGYRLRVD
jgi:two-component system phosphate regulon response regulator PhoB